ncbi:Cullin family-domain-containing protein [Mycena olivaceomarginata]|nr:Cullin family-domain-containing protein [Mycena olivaceomarginata]
MTKLETGLSFAGYMSLYTTVYNYCTSTKMHGKLEGNRTGANLVGADLYGKLTDHFANHFKPLVQRDEGKKAVYQVYTLALAQWRQHLFTPLQPPLTAAILRMVASQRDGAQIDQAFIKKVVDSFVSLGLDVYKEQFEAPFLAATEVYYTAEAEAGNIPEYLKKAEGRLREEEERVVRYLHAKTRKELVGRCENVLLRAHAPRMWDAFPGQCQLLIAPLDFDADEDLQRMYALLARIPEGLEPLRKKFEAHVKAAGLGAVSALRRPRARTRRAGRLDPKAYVDVLLAVHEKNAATVARSFKGEAGFAAALDKACREFVNRNAATGTSAARSPELLAKHADMLLRKSNKVAGDVDLEGALNRVMVLFKYLEDKDVFQTFYATKLSKRLIYGVSASDEAEASMISKLKEACGFEYTNKLQRMFTDMSLSKDLTDSFKERMAQNHDDMTLPAPTFERFTRYYQTKHSGRKLTWLPQLLEERAADKLHDQKYILMTSAAYQAADQYDLNPGFKSKKIRVNLNLPIKAEVKAESSDVLKAVDEDRKYARKMMKNQALIQEVISQISQRFAPKIPDIKKAIETLLEKEYIERVDGSKDTFAYVA